MTYKNNANTKTFDVESQTTTFNIDNHQGDSDDDKILYYPGIIFKKCLLPKCCYKLKFVLFLMCWAIVGQGMIVSGQLPITLPMLEKNFGYNSVQTGLIHSFYDAFFGVSAIVVGFFGRKRKMFVIGIGIFIMALGCFLFTLPNFIHNFSKHRTYSIDQTPTDRYIDYGIGAAPMHTLAVVYFDEHLNPHSNGMFLGIYYFFGAVGPALGFGLGSPFLAFPVTLKYNPYSLLTPSSESWVGAWWLGYIVGGGLLLIVGSFFVLFPTRIPPKLVSLSMKRLLITTSGRHQRSKQSKLNEIITYFKSFSKLFKNFPYMLLITGMSIEGIAINGLGTFLTKIVEVQFRVSSSKASLLSGALVVFGAGLGALLGGVIIKKISNLPERKALLIAIISFISTLFFSSFFFGCSARDIDLIILNDKLEITNEKLACQKKCNCVSHKYEPVCNLKTNKTYFSPCMTGCQNNYTKNDLLIFFNCTCLSSPNDEVAQGGCNKPCKLIWVYMPMSFLALVFNFIIFFVFVRLLSDKTKNSGTGLQQISARIGFIIGPIIYGHLLDINCILWPKESTDVISNCSEYNNKNMRFYLSFSSIGMKLVSSTCYLVTYIYVKKHYKSYVDSNDITAINSTGAIVENNHVEL